MDTEQSKELYIVMSLKRVIREKWWAYEVPYFMQISFAREGLMIRVDGKQPPIRGFIWSKQGFLMLRQVRLQMMVQAEESSRIGEKVAA